jgi:hypothetical protein
MLLHLSRKVLTLGVEDVDALPLPDLLPFELLKE